jgi:hypothetical protein
MTLFLFGISFPESGGVVSLPQQLTGQFDAVIQNQLLKIRNCRVQIVGTGYELWLQLQVPIRSDAGVWRPVPGTYPGAPLSFGVLPIGEAPATSFAVHAGGLSVVDTSWPANPIVVDATGLTIGFLGNPRSFVISEDSPLHIVPSGSGALALDLSGAPRLEMGVHSFEATTGHRLKQPNPNDENVLASFRFASKKWSSSAFSIDLRAGAQTTSIAFEQADAQVPFSLYGHVLGNQPVSSPNSPLISALRMKGAALLVGFKRDQGGVTVGELAVTPGATGAIALKSALYVDAASGAPIWHAEQRLELKLRAGARRRPATLLLSDQLADTPLVRGAVSFHGLVATAGFSVPDSARLVCEAGLGFTGAPLAGVESALLAELTVPRLAFGRSRVLHAKAGRAYAKQADAQLSVLELGGEALDLPLLGASIFQDESTHAVRDAHYAHLNSVGQGLSAALEPSINAKLMKEQAAPATPQVGAQDLFSVPTGGAPTTALQAATLARHEVLRDFGLIPPIPVTIKPGDRLGYVILDRNGATIEVNHQLDGVTLLKAGTAEQREHNALPVGVMKLDDSESLAEILDRHHFTGLVPGEVPRAILEEKAWQGVILFHVGVASIGLKLLNDLFPRGLHFSYFAFGPSAQGGRHHVNARIKWKNDAPSTAPPEDGKETRFRVDEIDILWQASRLVRCHVSAQLTFDGALGLWHAANGAKTLKLQGSYSEEESRLRFTGDLGEPLQILPDDVTFGPIRRLFLRSATIDVIDGKTAIQISGGAELGELPMLNKGVPRIDFDRLEVQLDGNVGSAAVRRLAIGYPNLRFRFDTAPFHFGFMDLKLRGLGIAFSNFKDLWRGTSLIDVGGHPGIDGTTQGALLEFRMELMKLPELALVSAERFTLDYFVGLELEHGRWLERGVRYGLRGLSLHGFRLDLLRFLTLEVKSAALEKTADGTSWLRLSRISLSMLNVKLLNNLSGAIFSRGNRVGFLVFLNQEISVGTLRIHWLVVGHGLSPSSDLARKIIGIEPGDASDIQRAISEGSLITNQGEATDGLESWVFAAGFDFLGLFEGKFLFQEQRYYGISMSGGILEEWFGYKIGISVLYIKGARPDEDSFAVAVQVPAVTLPAFRFMGGVVALEIFLNGGFALDVGFPWLLPGKPRAWDRAFGAIVGIFQGCAGFYLRKQTFTLIHEDGDERAITVAAGYALQAGLGGSIGAGGSVFRVWATVGLYIIIEGELWLLRKAGHGGLGDVAAFRLVGAVGILVRGGGELNFWIISVRIEVFISAEARLTVAWGRRDLLRKSGSSSVLPDASGKAVAEVAFELWARASARACIGKGWFKICVGIEVSVPMRFNYRLEL